MSVKSSALILGVAKAQAAIAQDPECQQAFAEIAKFATRISRELAIDLDL